PDVRAVMDHGKRDVASFPIATGEYYKVDYSPGTDISRYRNLPVPTSYMAYYSKYNYVGSYDWGRQAGLLHVANRHISPGKKQWTWGHGDFGRAWDRQLTDEDGPYIELMCGVYTDNQPDFSWLAPGEQKTFRQYFMPYKGVGRLGNATIDGCVGLELDGGRATARAYVTSPQPQCRLELRRHSGSVCEVIDSLTFDGTPERHETLTAAAPHIDEPDLEVVLLAGSGEELVSYRPEPATVEPIPEPAQEIGAPETLDSCESLYLAATHLGQYRHATRDPEPYLREALRRDPGDSRCHMALALLLTARGRSAEAEELYRAAIERLTRHNPNPITGEAHLGLGLTLVQLGRDEEAEAPLWKATWNEAEKPVAYFELARLTLRRAQAGTEHLQTALELLELCLRRNADHHQAAHLRVAVLFELGRRKEAMTAARAELRRDPFAFGVLWEMVTHGEQTGEAYHQRTRDDLHTAIELALDYTHAGMHDRARDVLESQLARSGEDTPGLALLRYHLAASLRRLQAGPEAASQLQLAAGMKRDGCFPNRLEDIGVLAQAMRQNPEDALAPYALGNLWYARRQHERAIECWRESARRDHSFSTVQRNLGLALYNVRHDGPNAWAAYEQAFELGPSDARVLFELDQLAKRLRHSPEERLRRLDLHAGVVAERDDLSLERVTLLNRLGRHEEALDAILSRRFRPWEGGEGKVPAQYVFALTRLAEQALGEARYEEAIELLERTEPWPESLGEGKLASVQQNDIQYLRGVAYHGLGDNERASALFRQASEGPAEPASAMFYNDQPPEMIYFQGLSLRALGHTDEAKDRFERLLEYGTQHLQDAPEIPYFAVSLPDFLVFEPDLKARNELHCQLMMALGLLGLEKRTEARQVFQRVLALDPSHQWAACLLSDLTDAEE
ncbi:MAG: DUF5107 domain-containing protein, partial [Phycisphaerales bacterium JB038]